MVKKIKNVYELLYVNVILIDCFFANIICRNVFFFKKVRFDSFNHKNR